VVSGAFATASAAFAAVCARSPQSPERSRGFSTRAAVSAALGALFAVSSAPRAAARRPPAVADESRGPCVNAVGGRSAASDASDRRRGCSAASRRRQ
jgi:hypothetical protein